MFIFLKKFFVFAFFLGTFLICHGDCEISRQKAQDVAKQMDQIIEEGMKQMNIPGCIFVMSKSSEIIHTKSFGKTSIEETKDNVDNDTLFAISSVTKNLTAFLVGALVDEKKISFDDKIRKYLPQFFLHSEELSNKLTILDLIGQRSGFKHFSADTLFKAGYSKNTILNAFKFFKQKPGSFRKNYSYQNIIFGLIQEVLEAATDEKYEDLVQKYIFDKMNMKNSSAINLSYEQSKWGHFKYIWSRFSYDSKKKGFFTTVKNLITSSLFFVPKNVSENHSRYNDKLIVLPKIGFFQEYNATSGISLSAKDFAKWIQMILNHGTFNDKKIVSKETFEKITSKLSYLKNIKKDDLTFISSRFAQNDMYYGIGTFISQYNDHGKNPREVLYHMGGIYGANAFFFASLDDDIAVGIIVNLGGVPQTLFAEYMCNQCLDLCFDFSKIDWVQEDVKRKDKLNKMLKDYITDLSQNNPSPKGESHKYCGNYSNEIYGIIKIFSKENKLYLTNGIKTTELEHLNGDIFKFPSYGIYYNFSDNDEFLVFKKNQYGNIEQITLSCFNENGATFSKTTKKE